MPFAIKIITQPRVYTSEFSAPALVLSVDQQYVGSIITSVVSRRARNRKNDIVQQIILTKDIDEAETFITLADAQKRCEELNMINSHYFFHVFEIIKF